MSHVPLGSFLVVLCSVDASVSSLPGYLRVVHCALVDHMVHEVDDGCSADGALSHEVLVHVHPDVAAARASAVQAPEVPEGYLLVVLHNGSESFFFSVECNHFKHFNFDGLSFI